MPSIHETAYPRIKSDPNPNDLITVYTPTAEEKEFAYKNTRSSGNKKQRFDAIDSLLSNDCDTLQKSCEEHLAYANNNYLPFILHLYHSKRSLLYQCLAGLDVCSTTQDKTTLRAIEILLEIRKNRKEWIDANLITNRGINFSWMPDKWLKVVVEKPSRGEPIKQINRKYFELCVFTLIAQELKSGDIYLVIKQN